ncbi:MAG: pseudouridine synthase [Paludibacteraceae bacterium]
MERQNENRRRSSASGASRDGKPFNSKNVKSFLKGTRGSSHDNYGNRNPDRKDFSRDENRNRYSDRTENRSERRDDRSNIGEKSNTENKKQFYSSDRKPYGDRNNDERRPQYGSERKPWVNRDGGNAGSERKPWVNRDGGNAGSERPRFVKKNDAGGRFSESTGDRRHFDRDERPRDGKLSFRKPGEANESRFVETRFDNKREGVTFRKRHNSADYDPNAKYSRKKQFEYRQSFVDPTKPIRLNKFLANAGICSRREADEYIQAGVISVNGTIISELGTKVLPTDNVMFHNQPVKIEKKIYILLNKPKDCITTSEDTHARTTVLDIVKNACSERIYPVGRLDRNTTGVLLLTNDGDLASKLTHPKYDKKKIYHVGLDRDLEKEDYEAIMNGIDLGEFTVKADAVEFVKEDSMREVGIEIHSGQNRVVRRIFEKLGYKITKLDRVYFAGLTKKNVPRGKYRFLSEKEVSILKMGAHE